MNELTLDERAEWISEAEQAIRGRMLVHHCDATQAYEGLRTHRVWRRDPVASAVLREAFLSIK